MEIPPYLHVSYDTFVYVIFISTPGLGFERRSFLHSGNQMKEASSIVAQFLLEWTPDTSEDGFSNYNFFMQFEIRPLFA